MGYQGCKGPGLSLRRREKWIGYCNLQQILSPALASLFARLEKYQPPHLKRWDATHYVVSFANLRRKGKIDEEGVPLTWPKTLPYPPIQTMGKTAGEVLVEARLLPEVKRYAAADPSAKIEWRPALPGFE